MDSRNSCSFRPAFSAPKYLATSTISPGKESRECSRVTVGEVANWIPFSRTTWVTSPAYDSGMSHELEAQTKGISLGLKDPRDLSCGLSWRKMKDMAPSEFLTVRPGLRVFSCLPTPLCSQDSGPVSPFTHTEAPVACEGLRLLGIITADSKKKTTQHRSFPLWQLQDPLLPSTHTRKLVIPRQEGDLARDGELSRGKPGEKLVVTVIDKKGHLL